VKVCVFCRARFAPAFSTQRFCCMEHRFWSKVSRRSPGECWLWTAGTDREGYGVFQLDGHQIRAPRLAFFLTHGHWPEPQALHGCDNPPCCNAENIAEHVHEGTPALNQREAVQRGRAVHPPGEGSVRAKLTDDQALEIRNRCRAGEIQRRLAEEFGVSCMTVSLIVRGRRYTR